jgi:photosystem II stability/assembly factor-like uncharacterized protein
MATSKARKKTSAKAAKHKKSSPSKVTNEELDAKEVAGIEPEPSEDLVTPGPRKKRKIGIPEARLTHHKARSAWFQTRATWPVRVAPVRKLVNERTRVEKALAQPANIPALWESVGPANIGGRVTSIVCHPTHPERIWAGSAGGGVWFSRDAGANWKCVWNDQDILVIGALAIDTRKPDVLYCGTGEANLSLDSYPGVGLYKSVDAGATWQLLASTERTGLPKNIGAIAIDPFNSKHILVGGVGYAEVSVSVQDFGGMYESFDAGVTWKRRTFVSDRNNWCHSIVFHPQTKGKIFAAFTEQGSRNGIWRSTDGGKNWEQLLKGLPEPSQFGRTTLAISPSKPDVMYAFAKDETSGSQDRLLGIFRTENGGNSWKDISGRHFRNEAQISYGNAIAVHPQRPNHVICGGVDLHLTTNGGETWKMVTRWDAVRGKPNYAHADHHALVMPAAIPGRVYDANDGGLDVSEDGGLSWSNRSTGLVITMFYDMDIAQTNGLVFGGGAQDNGTVITTDGAGTSFFELLGGDGGWLVFDPKRAGHIYASYYNMNIWRFRGKSDEADVSPPAGAAEKGSIWMAYVVMDPSNSNTVYTGSYRVWRTKDDADTWKPISPSLDGSSITAIEVAEVDPKRIYVGTENGGFFRSLDGGTSWSPNLSGSMLPGHTITRLETHPKDGKLVYATFANFGHSHLFRSKDGGTSWQDVDKGQLPDVPHHVVLIRPDEPDKVYVGNDAGVFILDTKSATWLNLTKNLPNAMVIDMVYHAKDGTLNAATYGRSIWRIRLK